jgi:hypothetical protein
VLTLRMRRTIPPFSHMRNYVQLQFQLGQSVGRLRLEPDISLVKVAQALLFEYVLVR